MVAMGNSDTMVAGGSDGNDNDVVIVTMAFVVVAMATIRLMIW